MTYLKNVIRKLKKYFKDKNGIKYIKLEAKMLFQIAF